MVFVPTPAIDGVKIPVPELTPGPEYTPPIGTPPLSLNAAALIVVILSKHRVKETEGEARAFITREFEVTGLFVMHERLEFITH